MSNQKMKTYRIRYYFDVVQEGYIKARSLDEANKKAVREAKSWGWDHPVPEVVDSSHNEIVVTEVQ